MVDWLERNVHVVLDRVDKCDAFVVECEEKRKRNYQKAPRNVLRHIVLSDIKEAMERLEVSFVQRSFKKKNQVNYCTLLSGHTTPQPLAWAILLCSEQTWH